MALTITGCTSLSGEITCGKLVSMIRNMLVKKEDKDVTSDQDSLIT